MQMYMNTVIKKPALEAVQVIFSDEASRIKKIKAAKTLWDVFQSLQGLPEPTKENTWHPNAHNLIDLREWMFKRCFLGSLRMVFIRRVINFIIILYDFDPPWRWIFDSVKDEALKMKWESRGYCDEWANTYAWWKDTTNANG